MSTHSDITDCIADIGLNKSGGQRATSITECFFVKGSKAIKIAISQNLDLPISGGSTIKST